MAFQGLNPDWKPEDIFKLSKLELDRLKGHVATKLECKWKNATGGPFTWTYALPVGGTPAFTEESAQKVITEYLKLINNKPVQGTSESEANFKAKTDKWRMDVANASTWSTVVNGCQIAWESSNGPWNEGYILSF